MSSINIVWVHLGAKQLPKYLEKSIRNVGELEPKAKRYLVVDQNHKFKNFDEGCQIIQIRSIETLWPSIRDFMYHNLEFRSGFWFHSLARFKAIQEFLTICNLDSAIHIESDVTILPNFPFSKFISVGDKLAFPIQGAGQGIGSILYFGSKQRAQELVSFAEQVIKAEGKATDMTILWEFMKKNPNKVHILPTIPELKASELLSSELAIANSERDFWGGIFDGISIGQYFFGVDPRNHRGIRRVFWKDNTHWFDASKYQFEIDEYSMKAISTDREWPIFNLHIHSKDLDCFCHKTLVKKTRLRLLQNSRKERSEFIFPVFLNGLMASAIRRIKRKIHI